MFGFLRKFKEGHKLSLALLGIGVSVGVACALTIPHRHDQLGQSQLDSNIPFSGKWRLKLQAPVSGSISGVFIRDDGMDWCGGLENISNGTAACGSACSRASEGWNFRTIANITQGVAYGWAWANEPSPPNCPNPNPNGPEGE